MSETLPEVSIVSLFIGRAYCLKQFLEGLEGLDYPKDKIHLVWHDTSHIKGFQKKLGDWLNAHGRGYASTTYIICENPHYHFEEKQYEALEAITEAYNHCRNVFRGDYFFALEDDVVSPPEALKKLLESMKNPDVKAAAGVTVYRPSSHETPNQPVAWNFAKIEVFPGEGIETGYECRLIEKLPTHKKVEFVGSAHLGCTLINGEFVRNNPFLARMDGAAYGCDVVVGYKICKQGYKYALDWGLRCKHYDIDGNFV